MKLKERLDKLEGKIGTKDKGWIVADLRPIDQEGKKVFSVIIGNEEIGVFPTEEEAEKAINERGKEASMTVIIKLAYNEDISE
ncbi:MAG: hypothetical protein PWP57_662 [Candidatus Atribacteria bacterium]|nr:hypothetical protein [Candidatus Atribacteria bacterium]